MSDTEQERPPAEETFEVEPEEDLEGVSEPELDPETAARRAAALAHVRKFGDPVLRTRARPVQEFDAALRSEVERMGELMGDALGVGLAATQVGVLHRLLV
jgi:peptide deformylase